MIKNKHNLSNLTLKENLLLFCLPNESGCWIWQKSSHKQGYAIVGIDYHKKRAHRLSYEAFKGEIPKGLVVDHLCRVRNCINPEHLEAVTHRENTLRGESASAKNAKKTHCPRGHEYSKENTYLYHRKDGCKARICHPCNLIRTRERTLNGPKRKVQQLPTNNAIKSMNKVTP